MQVLKQELAERVVVYFKDYNDASDAAKLLVKNGYMIQIGPADFTTQGVKVIIFNVAKECTFLALNLIKTVTKLEGL